MAFALRSHGGATRLALDVEGEILARQTNQLLDVGDRSARVVVLEVLDPLGHLAPRERAQLVADLLHRPDHSGREVIDLLQDVLQAAHQGSLGNGPVLLVELLEAILQIQVEHTARIIRAEVDGDALAKHPLVDQHIQNVQRPALARIPDIVEHAAAGVDNLFHDKVLKVQDVAVPYIGSGRADFIRVGLYCQ